MGLGLSCCVTTGNEADVTVGEAIGWMAEDPNTDVIVSYAEGIREADSFLAALEAARAARKPVVMMKVSGRLGSSAAQSHTASIAGNDAVTDAVLSEFGVVRARTTEELLDIAKLATRRIYPARNTLGVITISGGAGVLVSDAADDLGLEMPAMPEAAQAKLKQLLPICAPRNPVDCPAQAFNNLELIGRFANSMVEDGGYNSVLAFFSQIGGADSIAPYLREQLNATRQKYPDQLYVLSVIASPERIWDYEADGFAVYEDPTRAVVAIHAMGRFGASFARAPDKPPPVPPTVALPDASPNEVEAKRLLGQAGIATAPERLCTTAEDAVAAAE